MGNESTATLERVTAGELDSILAGFTTEPEVCSGCGDGSGYLWSAEENRIVGLCECHATQKARRLAEWKREETVRLKAILLPRIDLTATDKKPWYPRLPETGGAWISGPAEAGKTHAAGWMVAKRIKESARTFTWSWFSARQIFQAWSDQYADEYERRSGAKSVMHALTTSELIVINDFDKTGKITQAREEQMFDMIDSIHSRGAALIVPSNVTIDEFCRRMDNEDMFIKRDGRGPQERRLKEICKEIKL